MNEFALPRAILDFEHRSFLAWNQTFLEQIGYSEEELKSAKLEEVLTLSESWFPLSDERDGPKTEYVSCAAKRPLSAGEIPGYVVRAQDKMGYVMLEVTGSPSAEFEQGRIVGREEEGNRIRDTFHEEVSSSIIAALFLIEMAKSELEKAGSPQAETVSKVSDILTGATEKIAEVIGEPDRDSE